MSGKYNWLAAALLLCSCAAGIAQAGAGDLTITATQTVIQAGGNLTLYCVVPVDLDTWSPCDDQHPLPDQVRVTWSASLPPANPSSDGFSSVAVDAINPAPTSWPVTVSTTWTAPAVPGVYTITAVAVPNLGPGGMPLVLPAWGASNSPDPNSKSGTINITVVGIDHLTVTGATKEYPSNQNSNTWYAPIDNRTSEYVEVTAVLDPVVAEGDLPAGLPSWNGGTAVTGHPLSHRQAKTTKGTYNLSASVGSNYKTASLKIYDVALTVSRTEDDDFSGTATVAAGHIDNAVHEADVQIQTDPPVYGVTLSPRVTQDEGQGDPPPNDPDPRGANAADCTGSGTTDSNGQAVIGECYLSSNKVETVHIEMAVTGTGTDPDTNPEQLFTGSASIEQAGGTAAWTYNSWLDFDVASPVNIVLTGDGLDLPLPEHSIGFFITEITGWLWDDTSQGYDIPWVALRSDHIGDTTISDLYAVYGENVVIEIDDDLSWYGLFDPAAPLTDDDGMAGTELTVYCQEPQIVIDTIDFDANDESVWITAL